MTALHPQTGDVHYPAPRNSQPEHPSTAWTQSARTGPTMHTWAGWYADPSGRHESRYFDGQWTQHVSTRGVNSIDTLTAAPAPAVFGAPAYLPYVSVAQSGPSTESRPSGPGTRQRSPKVKLATAGAMVAVAGGIALAVALSGGGGSGHGFCADARALNARYPSARVVAADIEKNPAEISYMMSGLDTLAAESPSPQDAADLRYLARWLRNIDNGNDVTAEMEIPQATAAGNRVDAYINDTCIRHGS